MREIQGEALRLFVEQGYDQTTIEHVADAADISPRTFFRYFPTKEDVVLWDEYDAVVSELLESRPPDEPPAETFRLVTRASLEALCRRDPERLLLRYQLLATVPAVRGRFLEFTRSGVDELATRFAAHRGVAADDQGLRITAMAIVDAAMLALDRWQRSGGSENLVDLYDATVDALIDAIGKLRRRGRRSPRKERDAR
jgi:AcrR family transcriptional regulator